MSDPVDPSLKHVILKPGVVRGRPGNPPRSVKGRTQNSSSMGPWDMLKAMRRIQLGEPLRTVARSYGISHNTLQRWQTRWGGDVAHVRWHLDVEHIKAVEVAHRRAERRLRRSMYRLRVATTKETLVATARKLYDDVTADLAEAAKHMAHIDGDGINWWQAKREAACHIPPSKSRWRKVELEVNPKGRLESQRVATPRNASYWDEPGR